jgi:hypothetical protein
MEKKDPVSNDKPRVESKLSINKLILPNTSNLEISSSQSSTLPAKRPSASSSASSVEYNEEDDDFEGEEDDYYSNDDDRSRSPNPGSSPSRSLNRASDIYNLEHRSRKKISETRRAAHLESEKKRRLNINQGFEDLRKLVPECTIDDSKAEILRKSSGFIRKLLFLINRERNPESTVLPINTRPVATSDYRREKPKVVLPSFSHKMDNDRPDEGLTSDDEMVAESLTMMMSCR